MFITQYLNSKQALAVALLVLFFYRFFFVAFGTGVFSFFVLSPSTLYTLFHVALSTHFYLINAFIPCGFNLFRARKPRRFYRIKPTTISIKPSRHQKRESLITKHSQRDHLSYYETLLCLVFPEPSRSHANCGFL